MPAAQLLNAAQELDRSAPVVKESTLNMMGATLLQGGDKEQAVAVLEWAVAAYPQSANAHDSLAEAYESRGNKDKARAAAGKAKELLQKDSTLTAERKQRLEKAISDRLTRLQ